MTQKTVIATVTLVLALGVAVSSCSRDEATPGDAPTTTESSSPTAGAADPTTDPAAPATPSTEPSSDATTTAEPKPTVGEVGVLISNSEWDPTVGLTVRGYANTIDAEAVCTLDLTQGTTTHSVESEALPSASTMSCGELVVGPADLTSGAWEAVLSYESTTAWGTSSPVVVTVP